ncbi:hypothetical protein IV203_018591 [Nitzschia inconspicua]|uniref:EF-hand domain-containing protein n=1 Tax=Nitzschia inconspicua TaxID=303405 RepID=A0A9K3Q650_9STRA|nr:hypothetical protein IV203_018591 [Nitzschia inconspicua]
MRTFLWRMASLLLVSLVSSVSSSVRTTASSQKLLQLPDEYSRYAHSGLERDFQAILIQQEQDQLLLSQHYNDVYDSSSNDDAILTARFLQNDIAFCYDALYLADANKDARVDSNEFVTFVQIMGPPGFLPDVDTFNELPLIMQSNFIILACLCLQLPGSSPQCCTNSPHIDITGTQPGQVPTPQQVQYLYQVCFLTETSIDRVIASQTPTLSPQTDPPQTDPPTDPPAPPPTTPPVAPPTEAPSASPTITTLAPTTSPTVSNVTTVPTVVPTNATTASPTPTFVITAAPSASPPPNITLAPSGGNDTQTQTPSSTITPTRLPTFQPSTRPPLVSDQVVPANYEIAVRNGNQETIDPSTYVPSLVAAMDNLAQLVEESWNANQLLQEQEAANEVDNSNDANDDDDSLAISRKSPIDDFGNHNLRRNRKLYEEKTRFINPQQQQKQQKQDQPPSRRRRLAVAVEVDLPTSVAGTIDEVCPPFVPESDSCQNVAASIPLIVYLTGDDASQEDAALARDSFQMEMATAIQEGRLQQSLEQIDPDSVVYVTTGSSEAPTPTDVDGEDPEQQQDDNSLLNAGAIAGIAAGAGALVILSALLLTSRRRSNTRKTGDDEELLKDAEDKATAQQLSNDIAAADAKNYQEDENEPPYGSHSAMVGGGAVAAGASAAIASQPEDVRASTPPSPGKKKRYSSGALYEVPGARNVGSDDGSSAGESGWSSNQDMSSVDSKSLDSGPVYAGVAGAAVLAGAAAGVAAAMSQSESNSRSNSAEDLSITPSRDYSVDASLKSTYSELDHAIQKGDWAAVGVTAALLASQSHDEGSTQGSRPRINNKAALNPQRAAELDALVEAGDWEGVVAAAARFDAQEALRGGSTGSGGGSAHSRSLESHSGANSVGGSSIGTGPSFVSTSGTLESTTSPSTFTGANTATSDTASTRSKARKLNEIREEVEALVNAVVPEEADNVDEMMTQFRGREEELVETLRSMQERQVAQKARKESQKQAKRDAKAYVENQKQQEKFGAVDNTGNPADDKWMADIEKSDSDVPAAGGGAIAGLRTSATDDTEKEREAKKQLKEAIEKEDWTTVAAAAAGLSGHDIFHDDDEDTRDSVLEAASTSSGRSLEINALVDRGDWDGVVAAASRYVDADSRKTSVTDESVSIEERRRKRQERLKEEEEALAQAEIWDAIAEQTKAEDEAEEERASNAGANLAAAWAIDRSLNALTKAETDKSEESDKKGDDGGEV